MAGLKITFQLDDDDLRHLRRAMADAERVAKSRDESEILDAAFSLARRVQAADPPQFVAERVEVLEVIATMLRDREYSVPGSVRRRVLAALAYFGDPGGLIPDQAPVVGFLDDALLIEMVSDEFRDEISAYREFCRFRGEAVQRHAGADQRRELERALQQKRRQLRARIQERRDRAEDRARARGRFFKLWG